MATEILAALPGTSAWLTGYIIVTLLAALLYIYLGRRWTEISLHYISLYIFVSIWSGMMYMAYLWDTPLQRAAWYLDWFVTLPLLVLAIGLTAYCLDPEIDWSMVGSTIGLTLLSVTAGMMAIMVPAGRPTWLLFTIGAVFLGWLLFLLWGPLMREAGENSPRLHHQYYRLLSVFSILVVAYPLIWALSAPSGLGILSERVSTILLLFVVPVLMKPVLGVLNLWLLAEFTDPVGEDV